MRFAGQRLDSTARGQLRLAIKRMLVAKGYKAGEKLPTYRDLMDHLYSLGHRRIAYLDARAPDQVGILRVGVPVDSADTRERREAYLAAMGRPDVANQRQVLGALRGGLVGSVRQALAAITRRQRHPAWQGDRMFGKTMALQQRRTMPPGYCGRASQSAILAGMVLGVNMRLPVRPAWPARARSMAISPGGWVYWRR